MALNTVVLDGMAKGRQPSLLFVAVTGVVAATALLGAAVLVPELVPLLELPPVEPVPFGGVVDVPLVAGVVAPPDVLLVGGVVVLSVVDPPELAALLEPQALSAAKQTIEIAGKSKTRSFDAKIIATCFDSLS